MKLTRQSSRGLPMEMQQRVANGDSGDLLYDLTHSSRWLLHDSEQTMAPIVLLSNHPLQMTPWHYFSQCVKEGGIAFKKAHGVILSSYKQGLSSIGSLVDVGGGIRGLISDIVKAYPHIKGVNSNLPHVVSTARTYNGVSNIGGDMFHDAIPNADAVIMKVLP
ncbi:hypothetical protein PVK06_007075 [Gossypium arboreum]|uniref:O-methyltransferase C-terminal domain-containing protein n=1 Tax=Gossypium arboreum TaxID=29729 RepID=A0ABR0QGD1_GOSAR|nr:hypothetical protein PVK06_007075 [Gossypium arboreum]